jgi:hypothetical protein
MEGEGWQSTDEILKVFLVYELVCTVGGLEIETFAEVALPLPLDRIVLRIIFYDTLMSLDCRTGRRQL